MRFRASSRTFHKCIEIGSLIIDEMRFQSVFRASYLQSVDPRCKMFHDPDVKTSVQKGRLMQGLQFSKCPTFLACSPDSSRFYQTKYNQTVPPELSYLRPAAIESNSFVLSGIQKVSRRRTTEAERVETFVEWAFTADY